MRKCIRLDAKFAPKLKGKKSWLLSWIVFGNTVGGGSQLLQLREFVTCWGVVHEQKNYPFQR